MTADWEFEFGMREHVRAFELGDMSPGRKATTRRRSPKRLHSALRIPHSQEEFPQNVRTSDFGPWTSWYSPR